MRHVHKYMHTYKIYITFRNIGKLAEKCVNIVKGSIKFNRTCLNNGLYPKFVHVYNNITCIEFSSLL